MSTTFTHDSPSVTEQTTSNTRLDFQHHSIKLLDFKQSPYTVTQTWNFTGLLSDMDNSPNVNQYFLCHSNFISEIYFCLSVHHIFIKIVRKCSHVLWKNYIEKDIEDLDRSQRDYLIIEAFESQIWYNWTCFWWRCKMLLHLSLICM